MNLGRWRLLIRSLRHTRLPQLVHRLRLQVQRRLSAAGRDPSVRAQVAPVGADLIAEGHLPRPPMLSADGKSLSLLNQSLGLVLPMDWSVPGITVARPLAELEIHYLEWIRELDDDAFLAFSEDWIAQHLRPKGRWWNTSWNCYGLSIRTVVWMQEIAARFERLPAERRQRLCDEVAFQIRFLEKNLELDLGGNHLLKDLVALLWAGRFFVGAEADRWTRRGSALLARELDEQMPADGVHFERTPAYHALILLDLLDCYRVLRDGPLRSKLAGVLARGAQALVDLTHPDGGISLFNDGGLSKAPSTSQVLDTIAAVIPGRFAPRPVFAMEDSGYFGARNGADLFLADCGKIAPDHLPAHGHGDILAFEWSVDGKRIVTDFGVYEYTVGPWREMSRSTRSHNTVTVADQDQCEFWSAFRVGRRARIVHRRFEPRQGGFVLEGAHDGYAHLPGRPVHHRRFTVDAAGALIEDEVRGGRGQAVRSRLLFHPDCTLQLQAGRLRVEHSGTVVWVEFQGSASLVDTWWCPDFGKKIPTRQLVLDYGPAPCAVSFRLRRDVSPSSASGRPS